ncbi:ATP-binding cassette domain-containing protein [Nocardioides zeae]
MIEARGVRFGYGDGRAALDGLDLVVPRRGHTAIVGPSGAGKSTVFSLLLKFATPDAGDLELEGAPYAAWSAAQVRRRIGYVEQDTPLVPGTVRDNVALGTPDAADAAVWEVLRAVRLDARVAALAGGLDADVASTTLSGGERQRLAIARALLVRPQVLLLDEATAQLDALTEAAVADGISELARHGAVVSIAHRLSTVMDADQIVVLEDGRTRAVGTHGSLLATDELYAELVAALRIHPTPVVV